MELVPVRGSKHTYATCLDHGIVGQPLDPPASSLFLFISPVHHQPHTCSHLEKPQLLNHVVYLANFCCSNRKFNNLKS